MNSDFQQALDIVVSVFKEKNIDALSQVKDFLYSLPTPRDTEQALAAAIIYFAEHDQQVFDWILHHQEHLLPELDLFAFTRQLVRSRLLKKGWIQARDFDFYLSRLSLYSPLLSSNFESYLSQGELILVKNMFEISG